AQIGRERDAALARIERWLSRGWLTDASADWDAALLSARDLSARHTERLGCRGFDLLHVAFALATKCEIFLTADRIQGAVARAEVFEVTLNEQKWVSGNRPASFEFYLPNGIPCGSCARLDGFADHCLGCSANGM